MSGNITNGTITSNENLQGIVSVENSVNLTCLPRHALCGDSVRRRRLTTTIPDGCCQNTKCERRRPDVVDTCANASLRRLLAAVERGVLAAVPHV